MNTRSLAVAAVWALAVAALGAPFAAVLARTAAVTLTAAAIATIVSFPAALRALMPAQGRVGALALGLAPLLLPLPVTATVIAEIPGITAYSATHLVISHAVAGIPVAFLVTAAVMRGVAWPAVADAVSLGVAPHRALWRAGSGRWLGTIGLVVCATAVILATDPGIVAPFGGRDSFLAVATIHAATVDVPLAVTLRLVGIILVTCVALALAYREPISSQAIHLSSSQAALRPVRTRLGLLAAPSFAVSLAVAVRVAIRGFSPHPVFDAVDSIRATVFIAVPTLCVSILIAAVIARLTYKAGRTATAAVTVSLAAVAAAGPALARLHSPIWHIPALVGGAGLGQGAVGIALAEATIAIPAFVLVVVATLRTNERLVAAARDLGAGPVRTFATVVVPRTLGVWLGAATVVLALLLTRTSPAIYVDSPAFPQAAALLATQASEGNVEATYQLGWLVVTVGLVLVGLAGAVAWASMGRWRHAVGS